MADVLDLAGRLKVTSCLVLTEARNGGGLTRHLTALRVREFEVATSGGIWVAIRGLTSKFSGRRSRPMG
jgi:hypothetical protein